MKIDTDGMFVWAGEGPVEGVGPDAHYFNLPESVEVREFARSEALSNMPEVAGDAVKEMSEADETPAQAEAQAEAGPPTPDEIQEEPGGEQVSTLNRFLVDQAEENVTKENVEKLGYADGDIEDVQDAKGIMLNLLAMLRALHWTHQSIHWATHGNAYYGDHLLFQRLYEEGLPDEIDTLGEKCVAYFGYFSVDPISNMNRTLEWIKEWWDWPEDNQDEFAIMMTGLKAERDLQQQLTLAYKFIKEDNQMTLGLDDFLMAMANAHETNIYLLQQRLNGLAKVEFQLTASERKLRTAAIKLARESKALRPHLLPLLKGK